MVMCMYTVKACHNMSTQIKTCQTMSKPVKIRGSLCVSKVVEATVLFRAVKQVARLKTRSSSSPQMALIVVRAREGLPLSKYQKSGMSMPLPLSRMIRQKLRSQRRPASRRLKGLKLKGKCQKQEM